MYCSYGINCYLIVQYMYGSVLYVFNTGIGGILWDAFGRNIPFVVSAIVELMLGIFYLCLFTWKPIDLLRKDIENDALEEYK